MPHYQTIKMNDEQYVLMTEALRRFICFTRYTEGGKVTRQRIQGAWTGLGTTHQYRSVVNAGLMEPAKHLHQERKCPEPRIMGWWCLTALGAKIVYQWYRRGYCPREWEHKGCHDPVLRKGGYSYPTNKDHKSPPMTIKVRAVSC